MLGKRARDEAKVARRMLQLDRTQVAIRERNLLDLADLALLVLRRDFARLSLMLALGALPVAFLNHFLALRILEFPLPDVPQGPDDMELLFQFAVHSVLLTILTAPVGTLFLTWYLGRWMFFERPAWTDVVRQTLRFRVLVRWCVSLLLERGIAFGWMLYLLVRPGPSSSGTALVGLLMLLLLLIFGFVRAMRPFIPEIILLEQNPLTSRGGTVKTIRQRSRELHEPNSGDLLGRSLVTGLLGVILTGMLYGGFLFTSGVLQNDWSLGPVLIQVALPLALWIVAGYLAIVRFLTYLDTRIRSEGWEVELRVRAEALRVAEQIR